MMAAIFNSAMLDSDTAILDSRLPCYLLSDSFKNTLTPLWLWLKLIQSQLTRWWQPSWILPSWIQPFCTKRTFTCSFWLNFIMAAILNSAIQTLPSWIQTPCFLLSDSHKSTSLLTLKLILRLNSWWWQPSWILPCWIQTLPSWIQAF